MNNLKIIGFAGGDAQVIDLKKQDGSTVMTSAVATKEVCSMDESQKEGTIVTQLRELCWDAYFELRMWRDADPRVVEALLAAAQRREWEL